MGYGRIGKGQEKAGYRREAMGEGKGIGRERGKEKRMKDTGARNKDTGKLGTRKSGTKRAFLSQIKTDDQRR